MKTLSLSLLISLAGAAAAVCPKALAASTDDRLLLSADGSTLTGASGGGGGSIAWLHNFNLNNLAGAAVEYQTIANAHWTFGSLNASTTFGQAGAKTSLYGEIHEGAGDINARRFDYSIVTAGLIRTVGPHLSLQLEDRQIDIDTSRGNLPKLGASILWGPRLQTAIAYQHSVSGNLGTHLVSLRFDAYGKRLNGLAGGAFGTGSPAVFNLQTGLIQPGGKLREVFVGAAKAFARSDLTVVADYLDLAGTKRTTLTLNYLFDL
jgi:hypothetical protein